MTEMETRSVEVRDVNTEAREVSGIAVPYGQVVNVGGFTESFDRGAIEDITDVKLFWNHQEAIGRVVRGEETDEGYSITASISKTARGEEAYTLLKDGVINKFSVGFLPVESRTDDNGVLVRTKVDLKEVSLVPFPAYQGASVAEVRNENSNNTKEDISMSNVNEVDVTDLRDSVADLERRFNVLSLGDESTKAEPQFRSYGELVKGLADPAKAESAKAEVRAYTGGTFADNDNATRPGWINTQLKVTEEKRPVLGLFKKSALPTSGMTVEFPVVTGVAGTVGEQVNEGDDLPYTEVTTGVQSAAIKTYGGWTALSRQEIERTEVGMLDINLRNLVNQYAKATEKAVRDAFVGATGVNTGTLVGDTAGDWIDVVLDSAALIEDNSKGSQAEFVLVSRDVFKRLSHMVDASGRPLFVINGDGVNSIGNVNVRGASANIAGFPVVRGDALPANSLYVASSDALTVFEDPFKSLQDDNIINLTKEFSVYGYLAVGVTNPLAIVKVDADLV